MDSTHRTHQRSGQYVPEPDAVSLGIWLTKATSADSDVLCEALLSAVTAFNADTSIIGTTRFELAECLHPHVTLQTQHAFSLFEGQSLPYPRAIHHSVQLVARLNSELGRLYCSALSDSSSAACETERAASVNERMIYRGFEHFGRALLATALLYQPPAAGFWSDVYQSLRLAQSRRVNLSSQVESERTVRCPSPGGECKRLMMFAITNARRFRPAEMRQIFDLLGSLSSRATLGKEVTGHEEGIFAIDLSSDSPPSPLIRISNQDDPNLWFLSSVEVARILIHGEATDPKMDRVSVLRKSMMRRLARSLSAQDRRVATRTRQFGECRLAVGLTDILHVLSDNRTPAVPESISATSTANSQFGGRNPARSSSLVASGIAPSIGGATRSKVIRNESVIIDSFGALDSVAGIWDEIADAPSTVRQAGRPTTDRSRQRGRLVNSSKGGYRIAWLHVPPGTIGVSVGALVGVALGPSGLNIGIARWIHQDEQMLELGVELLSPAGKRVRAYTESTPIPGLLLPATQPLRPEPELLVAPRTLAPGATVLIEMPQAWRHTYLLDRIEVTHCFDRFALRSRATQGLV